MGAAVGEHQKENPSAGKPVGPAPRRQGRAVLAPLAPNTLPGAAATPRAMLKPEPGRTPLTRTQAASAAAQAGCPMPAASPAASCGSVTPAAGSGNQPSGLCMLQGRSCYSQQRHFPRGLGALLTPDTVLVRGAQTPLSCSQAPPRTWGSDLAAYLEAGAPAGAPAEAAAARAALASAVERAPASAAAWWALLSHEEAAGAALTGAPQRHAQRPYLPRASSHMLRRPWHRAATCRAHGCCTGLAAPRLSGGGLGCIVGAAAAAVAAFAPPGCCGAAGGLAEGAAGAGRAGVSLGQLFAWAVKTVPKSGNYASEAYLRLWLGCARHQWCARRARSPRRLLLLSRPAVSAGGWATPGRRASCSARPAVSTGSGRT